jgi:hypothetical protein
VIIPSYHITTAVGMETLNNTQITPPKCGKIKTLVLHQTIVLSIFYFEFDAFYVSYGLCRSFTTEGLHLQ